MIRYSEAAYCGVGLDVPGPPPAFYRFAFHKDKNKRSELAVHRGSCLRGGAREPVCGAGSAGAVTAVSAELPSLGGWSCKPRFTHPSFMRHSLAEHLLRNGPYAELNGR